MRYWLLTLIALSPVYGIIDNATIELKDRNPVSLRGFWNFSGGGKTQKLRIEKEWRLQGIENIRIAEFTLNISIPATLRSGDFGLILPPVSAVMRLYMNDKLVATKGKFSAETGFPMNSSEAFNWYPIKSEFLAAGIEQKLSLEIQGFQGGGGLYGNAHIYFGGIDEIKQRFNFLFLSIAFVAAAIFMIAVFHFALVPDRNYRRANLHYVLLSLAMSLHILGMNGVGYYLADIFILNAAMIHGLVAAFPMALTGFTLRYFRLKMPWVRIASYIYAASMATLLVACALIPDLISFYLRFGLPFGVTVMAVSLGFTIYGATRGVIEKIEGAKLVLSGFTVYGVAVLNDVLFYFSYSTSVKLADAGFLFAVVCVAVALAQRLQRAAQEKDELRDWKKEIKLAAQIQSLALPRRSISNVNLQIETLFKPMKIIGGDFFAFHEISENITGILIADVSGHGIAAALMVNTINSIFLQQKDHATEPAQLMRNMNHALYPHLQEQFVTAAYCLLNFSSGKISISQAGHPPIYLLRRDGTGLDKVKPKGKFLGFLPDLTYETAELDLREYSRMFLYSDGVIEAGAIQGHPYSIARLERFLVNSADLTPLNLLIALDEDIRLATATTMNHDDDSSCVVVDLMGAA